MYTVYVILYTPIYRKSKERSMKDEEERDNKRDISVIIPVYNVEKYIDQCLTVFRHRA